MYNSIFKANEPTFAIMNHQEYFENLSDLLKIEKSEDQAQYESLSKNTSISDRRSQGFCWYPIAIRGQEIGRGDYLTVELERTTHQDIPASFRFGTPAVLFSNHDAENDRVEGIVSYTGGNRLKLTLKTDELPDWSRLGKLGVELLFDNNSYQEMFDALKLAKNTENELLHCLTGEKKALFDERIEVKKAPELNEFQNSAVQKIMQADKLAIVHGPPGTGKTTTLVEAIYQLSKVKKDKILVVAPSNAAVDLLAEKLTQKGLNVLRIGNSVRVSENTSDLTIEEKMALHPTHKEIKRLKKQASEYKNMAHKYKRSFGKAERDQRKALFEEAHKIMKEVDKLEDYILEDIRSKTDVVTATLVGSNNYMIRQNEYDAVIIDEAGQCIEPACWIPILKGKKVILAGDHCQLPPTIKSGEAARKGLQNTLFEKLIEKRPEAVILLEEQYRMNSCIMAYSSQVFYGNKLKAHQSVANHTIGKLNYALKFIDTAGKGFEEKLEGTSTTNPEEALFVMERLKEILGNHENHISSIAVISPYKQQINILNDILNQTESLQRHKHKISINTIDSFQGQEREVVFISLTRSNDKSEIGFLADIRRMNVAMTRAQKLLIVVGDSGTLASHSFYKDFINYAESIYAYQSAWEYG